jgi:hypothetical protein
MKTHAGGGIVMSTIANAKADNSFRSQSSVATPIVRLTKGFHHVTQQADNDVGIGKFFSSVGDRLGTVGGGRA